MREVVRALGEEGVEPVAASIGRLERLGRRTIARQVVARVRRLAPAAERIARAAAVLGGDADLGRVIRLADVDGESALDALDALSMAGVISSTRPLEFSHPVIRAAIYGELAPGERTRMHLRAGALLTQEGAEDERIASHMIAGEPRGAEDVVDLLLRTARTAAAQGAPSSAVAYLERALAEPPAAELRARVLHELGAAEYHSGWSSAQASICARHSASPNPAATER